MLDEMTFETPPQCNGCGKKTKNMKEGQEWIQINPQNMGLVGCMFYACPYCHSLFVNSNIIANIKLIQEDAEKVIVPASGGSKLILPS